MTPGQNKMYWRRWSFVSRANHWLWTKDRLDPAAIKDAGPHHQAVWTRAGELAAQHYRAVAAEDLRHACHVHALGRQISHTTLNNAQFDRLLLLWGNESRGTDKITGLLVSHLDVAAQLAWDHPELPQKDRLIHAITDTADHAYTCSISEDLFQTRYWEDLPNEDLLTLLRLLKTRAPERAGQPF